MGEGTEWGGAEENNRIADPATVSEDGRSSDLVTRSILIIAWGGEARDRNEASNCG